MSCLSLSPITITPYDNPPIPAAEMIFRSCRRARDRFLAWHPAGYLCSPYSLLLACLVILLASHPNRPITGRSLDTYPADRFLFVVPDPENSQGNPLVLQGINGVADFRTRHPLAPLVLPPGRQGNFFSSRSYVIYSSVKQGEGALVLVSTQPDKPDTGRLGHFYTRRTLYQASGTTLTPVAYKLDIPFVHYATASIIPFLFFYLPLLMLVRMFALLGMQSGPPFSPGWLVVWGGTLRHVLPPANWEPVREALQATGARLLPAQGHRFLRARLPDGGQLNVFHSVEEGYTVATLDTRRHRIAFVGTFLAPAMVILGVDDILATSIDPLLPAYSTFTRSGLIGGGILGCVYSWWLIRRSRSFDTLNQLARVFLDSMAAQGSRLEPATKWDQIRARKN